MKMMIMKIMTMAVTIMVMMTMVVTTMTMMVTTMMMMMMAFKVIEHYNTGNELPGAPSGQTKVTIRRMLMMIYYMLLTLMVIG